MALTPPSADGTLTTLFPTADTCVALGMDATCVGQADIQSYDINFNADAIVFSASFGGGTSSTRSTRAQTGWSRTPSS